MRYFGTNFSLILGGMRLRVRIDIDDAPDPVPVRHHVAAQDAYAPPPRPAVHARGRG